MSQSVLRRWLHGFSFAQRAAILDPKPLVQAALMVPVFALELSKDVAWLEAAQAYGTAVSTRVNALQTGQQRKLCDLVGGSTLHRLRYPALKGVHIPPWQSPFT